jgi:hypothetical protein
VSREKREQNKINFNSFDLKTEFDAVEENDIKVLVNDPIYLSQLFVKLICQLILITPGM